MECMPKPRCIDCEVIISKRKCTRCLSCAMKQRNLLGQVNTKATWRKALKSRRSYTGSNNPRWRGGRLNDRGYIRVYSPEHPCQVKGYVYEHRLIVERCLGRYLTAEEVVHHIDGDNTNNDPSNLRAMLQSEHCKLHMERG